MKKGAALFLCMLLLTSFVLPARAEGERLLYPGVSIQGDGVYLAGVSTEGGTIQATANGTAVSCTSLSLQEAQLGVTYYCVASVTSSLSDVQREQQRSGLLAISEAMGVNDSMVLVSMGREVSFSEKLTDAAARAEAIEGLEYATFGTNLFESIYTVLSTASEAEGFCSVVFFTDGCDHSDVVKFTEEQSARIIQDSGLCVSFLVLLTPPVSNFASGRADVMKQYADLSLGGVYSAPLLESEINYISIMEDAARQAVNQAGSWTAFRFDAAQLPRDSETVELSVTWTGSDTSITGTAQVSTAALPALPEPTQPETVPETVPETQPETVPETTPETVPETEPETVPETTLPPQTEAAQAEVPEYQQDDSRTMYYAVIGGAAILLIVVLLILAARRAKRKPHASSAPAIEPDAQTGQPAPVKPKEPAPPVVPQASEEAPEPEEVKPEIQPIAAEAPIEAQVPAEPEQAAPVPVEPEEIKLEIPPIVAEEPAEAPVQTEPEEETVAPTEPEEAEPEIQPIVTEEPAEAPVQTEPEQAAPVPVEPEEIKLEIPPIVTEEPTEAQVPAEPEQAAPTPMEESSEAAFNLEDIYKLLGEPAPAEPKMEVEAEPPVEVQLPAETEQQAPALADSSGGTFSMEILQQFLSGAASEEPEKETLAPAEPSEDSFSLDDIYQLLGEPAPAEPEEPRAEIWPIAAEAPAEVQIPAEPEEPAPARPVERKAEKPPVKAEPPKKRATLPEPVEQPEPAAERKPAKQRHSLFHHRERWIDDVTGRQDDVPIALQPELKAPTVVPSCTVRLMPEGNPGGSVYVVMEPNSSRTLGRNQKADIILNKTDTCLSGLHFELQWDGRVLYLTDRNSTNGTAVTGVLQKPGHWTRVESGATIRAGNTRYKVKIMRN